MGAYDIIGDIHGHAQELTCLLDKLGYRRHGRGYRHPNRKLVFVGDFVDRGPAVSEVISIVRAIVDAGDGFTVMGNHEYNAIAFHTPVPGKRERWFRRHSDKNLRQHRATLEQLSPDEMADALAWFKTLPVALEIGGFRVVHAAWQGRQIDTIRRALTSRGRFDAPFFMESESKGSDLKIAIESVLKGPQLTLPAGHSIVDKAGHQRDAVRIKWYEEPVGRTYRGFHLGSDEVPDVAIDASSIDGMTAYPASAPPVFVGHYWLTGIPSPLSPNVACTDYSVAKGGKLVAYRWEGESVLSADRFCWVKH